MRVESGIAARVAGQNLAKAFLADGWTAESPLRGRLQPDLVVRKGHLRYAIELKALREGRSDRAVALLSQAILQARRYADEQAALPLAVVQVGRSSASLLERVAAFREAYAPDVAIGLVAESGERRFIGEGLDGLNVEAAGVFERGRAARPRKASALFSDLNQWMLKVLLAPELPAHLLTAPRGEYAGGSALAEAAQVSPMSASRCVRRLREEGFLEHSGRAFRLVRRRELFRRWRAAASQVPPELPMCHLIPAPGARQLHDVAARMDACIGLFGAADLLQLSHVSGVTPYLYVRRLARPRDGWSGLVPAAPGDAAQLVLRQAGSPESIFRAAVHIQGVAVCDVLQVWLDVSAHSSRGAEQADWLQSNVLAKLIDTDA